MRFLIAGLVTLIPTISAHGQVRQDIGAWLQGQPAAATMNSADILFTYQGGIDKKLSYGTLSSLLLQTTPTVLNVLSFANGVDIGNPANDAGPAIRAGIAACQASAGGAGYAKLYFPHPSGGVGYLFKTIDPSGTGAMVIAPGSSCMFDGEGWNTGGGFTGGVNIKLNDGLNVPLLYISQSTTAGNNPGSPFFNKVRLDGNGFNQTTCNAVGGSGNCPSGALYTIVVADCPGSSCSPESAIQIRDSWVINGRNGNLYVGAGRGGLICTNTWFQYTAVGTSDFNVFLNGSDAEFRACVFAGSKGWGLVANEGSQYFGINNTIFSNNVGMAVNSAVGYLTFANTNFQYNLTNALQVNGPATSTNGASIIFVAPTFDGNSFASNGTSADVLVTNHTGLALDAPGFLGNVLASVGNPCGTVSPQVNCPIYNIQTSGTSVVQVSNPVYKPGLSATTSLASDITKIITLAAGVLASPSGSDLFLNSRNANVNFQFNGTTAIAMAATAINPLSNNAVNLGVAGTNAWSNVASTKFTATGAATAVSAGQISYGGTTVAAGSGTCPTGTVGGQTVAGCIVVNIAGTSRNVPFF